jgi:hypothetical protein
MNPIFFHKYPAFTGFGRRYAAVSGTLQNGLLMWFQKFRRLNKV